MVVPRSTELINEDQDFGLFTVTVFRKIADEYKNKAREKRSVDLYSMCVHAYIVSLFKCRINS